MKFKLNENLDKILSLKEDRSFREVHIGKDGSIYDQEGKPMRLSPNPNFGDSFKPFGDKADDDIIDLSKYNELNHVPDDWASLYDDKSTAKNRPSASNNDQYGEKGRAGDPGDKKMPDGSDINGEGEYEGDGKDGKEGEGKEGAGKEGEGKEGNNKNNSKNKSRKRSKSNGGGSGKGENIYTLIIESITAILKNLDIVTPELNTIQDIEKVKTQGDSAIMDATATAALVEAAEQGAVEDSTLDDIWDFNKKLKQSVDVFNTELAKIDLSTNSQDSDILQKIQDINDDKEFLADIIDEVLEIAISIQEKIFDYYPNKCYTYIDNNTGDEYIKFGEDNYIKIEDYYEMGDM